ncbi:putative reverse transcriptase domain-containing protein [Tanacetum coccineum]|uniref:Reverse transcriptase domain-containing protein n=1 Tax=Tanacetum coccineum TaxID=301880 RepID=A0ABQ4YHE1_9ASTR
MLAQVGNQGNVRNQNGNVLNKNVQENVGNVILNGNRVGCSYKEFLACNPKECDGKGGAVVLTRWIEKMESVQDMSGCSIDQKVKYTAGSFVGKVLTWWNSQILTLSREVAIKIELWNHAIVGAGHATYTNRFHELDRLVPHLVTPKSRKIKRYVYGLAPQIRRMVAATKPKTIQKAVQIFGALTDEAVRNGSIKKVEKRGNVGEPSKDKNGRDDNKRTRTGNAFASTVNPVGRENMGTWPKCATCNSYHAPAGPCRTCFNCNRSGLLANDYRGVPIKVNPVNARNPTVRSCYECGSIDHVMSACPRLNRAQGPEGKSSKPSCIEPSKLAFRYKIEIACGQLVEIDKLEAHGAEVSTEDANHKFLRSLPPAWSNLAMTMRTKPDVDTLSIDNLYNNLSLRVFKQEMQDDRSSEYSTCQSNDSAGSIGTSSEHSVDLESEISRVPQEVYVSKPVTTNEKGEGYSFIKKKCFVCGSLSHLIRNCDFYEKKMAREAELKKQRVFNTGNGVAKPVWNNANRVNHANHFVPRPVQLIAVRQNVNSVRPNVNTGRANVNSVRSNVNTGSFNVNTVKTKHPIHTSNSNSFSPVRPQVNKFNQRSHFSKSHSPVRRPIVRNTAKMTYSHVVKGNWGTAVKTSACYNWRKTRPNSNCNSGSNFIRTDHPLKNMEDRGIFDSGCSGHMTGNKDHLDDFEECKGGSVTFGGSKGYITGKGRIRVVPRQQNMYSFDMKTPAPAKGYTCLITKATSDESKLWHRRFSWVFFLATKDETSGILQNFIRQIENQLNHRVKIIRSDNGTEFKNRDMLEFCGNKGIKQEYSNARTPQQNGAEAVSTACYIFNRVRVTKPQNKTPYELLFGHKPIISYIRPFGCHVTILDTLSVLGKFDGKCDEGFLVGYSLNSKAFRVYNLVTKKVEVNLHVKFLEEKPNVKGVGTSEVTNSAGTLQTPNANASEEEDEAEELIVVPTTVRHTASKVRPRKSSTNSKAKEFLTELQNLKTQEKEAYSTGISEDTPEILAFRRELDELAPKHLREVPKHKATSTNSVNSGSGPVNT